MHMLAPEVLGFAIPNAGKRNPIQARKEGIMAGVFDTEWRWNHGSAFIELKGYARPRGQAIAGADLIRQQAPSHGAPRRLLLHTRAGDPVPAGRRCAVSQHSGGAAVSEARPIGEITHEITRGIWLGSIDTCPDLTARRHRIATARAKGIITPDEAAAKLAIAEALAA